jgi:hypothetical protein
VLTRHVATRVRPPWFNGVILQARRDRKKAERRWRARRLLEDQASFRAKTHYAIHVMNEAELGYYRQFTKDNGDDQSKLFRASKHLLNMQPDKVLPPYTNALTLANEMGELFFTKDHFS